MRALVTWATGVPLGSGDDAVRMRWLDLPGSNPALEQIVQPSIDWLARHLP